MNLSLSQRIFCVLAFITLPYSCTIEKRVHRKGYHIEWLKSHHHFPESQNTVLISREKKEPEIIQTPSAPNTITSISPIAISNSCRSDTTSAENKIAGKAEPQQPAQPGVDAIT
jgi:hypothetical protein